MGVFAASWLISAWGMEVAANRSDASKGWPPGRQYWARVKVDWAQAMICVGIRSASSQNEEEKNGFWTYPLEIFTYHVIDFFG